jgi:predicted nucleic acid-binding protein
MTIIDTSVWIEYFEGGTHWTKDRLKELIADRETVCYIELIFLEILQGVRDPKDREEIENKFNPFIFIETKRSTTRLAAEIYQGLQRKGIRIRSIVDCLIAASSIETGAKILHKDRDFDFIERHYPIVVIKEFDANKGEAGNA